ncbi:MAG: A/G-specific adenine glycosylase [Betaproteobacteria bacterium]|nr:A/G-specific adenine glycosylase [Betaproteobacteria bacterium]
MPSRTPSFAARIVAWQRRHGRSDLPWQGTRDPYRIWISEIMLQQTQVATAIPYFDRFLARFPDVAALAAVPEDEVMRLWSGLGYYARARNLHRAARAIVAEHGGRFPLSMKEALVLPGIGRSTAAAILVFSTGEAHAILDGNVKRVFARHFGIPGAVDSAATLAQLWRLAESLVPPKDAERYTQGLMDLGATVCTRTNPGCANCPVRSSCVALRDGRIAQLPGRKPARTSPVREVAMLVIVSRGEVLVEKRPSPGIWGGLWSLPEAPVNAEPAAWAAKVLGLRVDRADALEPFKHAFTHFTLGAKPWLLRLKGKVPAAREAGAMWLPLQEVAAAALPAPVKRLLARLARARA